MRVAVFAFVYNEKINLPLWIRYYGSQFGKMNLFVIDQGSTDGSTENLGEVNRIRLPRTEYDEDKREDFLSSFQRGLLTHYDVVIYTDCDEIIVPDPDFYADLKDYIAKCKFECVTCVGVNVMHIINRELPLDLDQPILGQRRFGRFRSSQCKTLISRVPLIWQPGNHACDKPLNLDKKLILFHTKFMDYAIAIERQKINLEVKWSEASLAKGFGAHSRFPLKRYINDTFIAALNELNNKEESLGFSLDDELARLVSETTEASGFFYPPMSLAKYVDIPVRFSRAF